MNFTAIILAGGRSRRMGTNKALVACNGMPLILYSINLALQFTRDVLISANGRDLQPFGFPVIKDQYPVKAPIAGIHAGLVASNTPWNLVLTCDMPAVTGELIGLLVSGLPAADKMLIPSHNRLMEPLCGFYHRDILPELVKNMDSGKYSLLDLIAGNPHRYMPVDGLTTEKPEILFRNVNTLNDLTP